MVLAVGVPALGEPEGPALPASVDRAAGELMAKQHVPGVAVAVVKHGAIVYEHGYGYADLSGKVPVTVDTRFEIGSITKQFTAAAIMQLVRAGKLSLDDRLGTFITEYPAGAEVTVRQMLSHTSGLPEYLDYELGHEAGTRPASLATILGGIAKTPLAFAPGSRWSYSNTNYLLLGRIIELTANEPYTQYVREHIFEPAHMAQSGFVSEERALPDMAIGYEKTGPTSIGPAKPIAEEWAGGAGAIVSTVGDLAKWNAALASGAIVAPADLSLLQTAATLNDGSKTRYGLGFAVDTFGGHPRIWHNGQSNGFAATSAQFPSDDESIIVLDNLAPSAPGRIMDAIFAAAHPDVTAKFNTAAPGEDKAVSARVRSWLRRIAAGSIDRSQVSARFAAYLTPPALAFAKQELGPLGPATRIVFRGKTTRDGTTTYSYNVTFGTDQEAVTVSIDAQDKISGFIFRQPVDTVAAVNLNPAPKDDPGVTARLRDWLHRLATGDIDRSQLADPASSFFTPQRVAQAKKAFGPLGSPQTIDFTGKKTLKIVEKGQPAVLKRVSTYAVTFARARAKIFLGSTNAGKIDVLMYMLTATAPPSSVPQ